MNPRRFLPLIVTILLPSLFLLLLLRLQSKPLAAVPTSTFSVTKTVDIADGFCDADCSLRDAVTAANNNPGPDTIILLPGSYQLLLPGFDDLNLLGDLDSHGPLTILGSGADMTTIDANQLDRALHAITGSLTISGVTIFNGREIFGDGGGGILAQGSVALTATTVLSNVSNSDGGGLAVYGSLSISDTLFQENESTSNRGGGAFISGTLSLNSSEFFSNSAGGDGGGLYLFVTTATVNGPNAAQVTPLSPTQHKYIGRDTIYRDNVTGGYGGAIAIDSDLRIIIDIIPWDDPPATVDLRNLQVLNNSAVRSCGGGVATQRVNLNIFDSNITGNVAQAGGALCFIAPSVPDPSLDLQLEMNNNTIDRNVTFFGDTAAVTAENADVTIRGNTFFGNDTHLAILGHGNVEDNFYSGASGLGSMIKADARLQESLVFFHNTLRARPSSPDSPFQTVGIAANGEGIVWVINTMIDGTNIGIERGAGQVQENFNLFSTDTIIPTRGGVNSGGNSFIGDPDFVDSEACDTQIETCDLHLKETSDAIDAGTDSESDPDSQLDTDIDGEARPQDGDGDGIAHSDIGADEYTMLPPSPDDFDLYMPGLFSRYGFEP